MRNGLRVALFFIFKVFPLGTTYHAPKSTQDRKAQLNTLCKTNAHAIVQDKSQRALPASRGPGHSPVSTLSSQTSPYLLQLTLPSESQQACHLQAVVSFCLGFEDYTCDVLMSEGFFHTLSPYGLHRLSLFLLAYHFT